MRRLLASGCATLLCAASAQGQIYSWDDGSLLSDRAVGPGADLTGLNLDKADLRGLDLSGADFTASTLTEAWFDDSNLSGSQFVASTITYPRFDNTNLSDAVAIDSDIFAPNCTFTRFDRALFQGGYLYIEASDCTLDMAVFQNDIEGSFDGSDSFIGTDFSLCNTPYEGPAFFGCVFDNTVFGDISQHYFFDNCDFRAADISTYHPGYGVLVYNDFEGQTIGEVYIDDEGFLGLGDNSFRYATIDDFSYELRYGSGNRLLDLTGAAVGHLYLLEDIHNFPYCFINAVLDGAVVDRFGCDSLGLVITSAVGARLNNAFIGGALGGDFTDADFSGSHFYGYSSNYTYCVPARLEGEFRGATFDGSIMSVRMDCQDFRDAGFRGVVFEELIGNCNGLNLNSIAGADLRGADFTGATGWENLDWTAARYDENTALPDGLDPAAEGLIFVSQGVADMTTTGANPGDPGYGDPDGFVDGADLAFFIEQWLSVSPRADVATDGAMPGDPDFDTSDCNVSGADLSRYVEMWLDQAF